MNVPRHHLQRIFNLRFDQRPFPIFLQQTLIYIYVVICTELLFNNRHVISNLNYIQKITSFTVDTVVRRVGPDIARPFVYNTLIFTLKCISIV